MKWWMLAWGFVVGMATMALIDDLTILKQKEKLYSYTDGKDWYMCDNENAHCYTDRFKSEGAMHNYGICINGIRICADLDKDGNITSKNNRICEVPSGGMNCP